MEKKLKLLVLESPWSKDLADETSVRLFIRGWGDLRNIEISYRMYHDKNDLAHWLGLFMAHPALRICYIAGHGQGSRLTGLTKDINPSSISKATKRRGKVGNYQKGILLGSCEVGSDLRKLLNKCGKRISWVAGYDREIPWMEATICDLLFIDYMLIGRIKVRKDGKFSKRRGEFLSSKPKGAAAAAKWVRRDCKLAVRCGFKAVDR
jgi:hypothetical protein